jgi:hypothetical protein
MQIAALIAGVIATSLGVRALLAPLLASPRWGPLLRAIVIGALVITYASVILAEVVRKASHAISS